MAYQLETLKWKWTYNMTSDDRLRNIGRLTGGFANRLKLNRTQSPKTHIKGSYILHPKDPNNPIDQAIMAKTEAKRERKRLTRLA
tara:strand:- start:357 stop:611 length:255 start_codon:yes stop_codon:yes gene_type:complete